MKGISWILGLVVGIVLLVTAWQAAFPRESALVREAVSAVEATGGKAAEVVEHSGTRSNAVCGRTDNGRFVYVNSKLRLEGSMSVEQFEAFVIARCRSPLG